MSAITTVEADIDQELVRRAASLRPLLAKHATEHEAQRRLSPEVWDALETTGLFEVIVPKRAGGLGATMATQLSVAAELARACTSTAWVQTIVNITTWGASLSAVGAGLFAAGASDGRPRVCGVIAPTGVARPTEGGYIVTGRWPFASGSLHASWFNGGVLLEDGHGAVVGAAMVLIPRDDYEIDDTWYVAGMGGTGSNTVTVQDVFVPAGRLVAIGDSTPVGDEPNDRWPLGSALSLVIVGPILGAAKACAEAVVEKVPTRAISYTSYAHTSESMVAVAETARALLDIDTAWLHAFQAAAYIDGVGAGAARDPIEEARVRGQCGYLTQCVRRGVDTLVDVGGAGSFASANSVQRLWRDINVASRHAFLATNVSFETYGRALFGLDPVVLIV